MDTKLNFFMEKIESKNHNKFKDKYKGDINEIKNKYNLNIENLHNLLRIINFFENVTTMIHGIKETNNIYKIILEEFKKSKYSASILLLNNDKSNLKVIDSTLSRDKIGILERVSGLHLHEHIISLNKSNILKQVAINSKTLQVNVSDIVQEILPKPLAIIVNKSMGFNKRLSILTPLKIHGDNIGVIAVSTTRLSEFLIPSIENFGKHISSALELATEHSEKIKIEKKLRESEERYRDLFENANDIILAIKLNGSFLYVNNSFKKILGYNQEEINNLNLFQIYYQVR